MSATDISADVALNRTLANLPSSGPDASPQTIVRRVAIVIQRWGTLRWGRVWFRGPPSFSPSRSLREKSPRASAGLEYQLE
jgi:hypothetical protein